MSFRWFTRLLLVTVAGLLATSAVVLADPPIRVARISFIAGSVSFRPASLDEWCVATLNYPLTIGYHLWTDRAARTELQFGSTVVRIAPYTEFSVLNLDDRTAQLRVTQGSVSVRVRTFSDLDDLEIDTPNGAVSLLQPGLYRIDVNEAGDSSTVTVRQGAAEVVANESVFHVLGDQSLALTGIDAPQSELRASVSIDEFDNWSLARDRRSDNLLAARYVSPDMIGYEDLDANGTWEFVPEYGSVWMPRVRAEWVPYRYGHWAWVDPWGWTWIDDAAWGFAPFHYGRWAFVPTRGWAWVPGTIVERPVYAPALVAFVGGSDWSFSLRLGSAPISWFPLGPREVFVPAYRVTPEYLQRVNVPHVTNVTNITNVNVTNIIYVNRTVAGAVTAVSRDTFIQARPVAAAAVAVPREQLRAARVVVTAPVAPVRASLIGQPHADQAQARPPMPPPAAIIRQVVVRTAPPPPPVAFTAKQAALAQHPGQPVDEATEIMLRARTAQPQTMHPLVRAAAPTAAAPAASAKPAVVRPPSSPPLPLAARQNQERADIDARHAQERAALQARHQQEIQQASDAKAREQLQLQHLQEIKKLQDQQQQEKAALQKRQQDERKKKEPVKSTSNAAPSS